MSEFRLRGGPNQNRNRLKDEYNNISSPKDKSSRTENNVSNIISQTAPLKHGSKVVDLKSNTPGVPNL